MTLRETTIPGRFEVKNENGTICGWVIKHQYMRSTVDDPTPVPVTFWMARCRGMLKQDARFDSPKDAAEYVESHAFRTSHRGTQLAPKGRPKRKQTV